MDVTVPEQAYAVALQQLLTINKDVDCRRVPVRHVRGIAGRIMRDLGSDLSEAQQQLVQRTAVLAALLEDFEARLLRGERVSIPDYLEMCNVQRRLLATLGLKRVARDVTPSVEDYFAYKARQRAETAE